MLNFCGLISYKMLKNTASEPQTQESLSSLSYNLHIVTKSYCFSLFIFNNSPIYFFLYIPQAQTTLSRVDYGKAVLIFLTSLHTMSRMYFLTYILSSLPYMVFLWLSITYKKEKIVFSMEFRQKPQGGKCLMGVVVKINDSTHGNSALSTKCCCLISNKSCFEHF